MQEKLSLASAGITFTALRCLCVSDNVEALDDLLYTEITPAIDAVWKALLFGLPEPKKPRAATLTNGQQKSLGEILSHCLWRPRLVAGNICRCDHARSLGRAGRLERG